MLSSIGRARLERGAVSTASATTSSRSTGSVLERSSLVEAREQQQVVDEHAHAPRFALDAGHRALEVVGTRVGAAAEQLGVGADGGERRPQLVRRVGDEAAQPRLGRCASRRSGLDLAQHGVQRHAEPADLGVRLRALDAPREVAGGDRGRRRLDRRQRPQADADDPDAERDDPGSTRRRHEQLDQQQSRRSVRVDVGERRGRLQNCAVLLELDVRTRKRPPPDCAGTVS